MKATLKNTEIIQELNGIPRFLWRAHTNVIITARIKGNFSVEELKQALLKVRTKHPILGTRLQVNEDDSAWFTTKNVPEFSVEVIENANNNQWMERGEEEIKYKFPFEDGPLIKFILFKFAEATTSDLMINCSHCICDGLSLAYLIRDIMEYLGDPEKIVNVTPAPPLSREIIPPSITGNFIMKKLIKTGNNRIKKGKMFSNLTITGKEYPNHYDHTDPNTNPLSTVNKKISTISCLLDKFQVSSLISRCKSENVTVHSALCTAFLAAQKEIQEIPLDQKTNLSSAVSLRKYLSPHVDEVFGCYATEMGIDIIYNNKEDFWTISRTIQKEHKKHLNDKEILNWIYYSTLISPTLADWLVNMQINVKKVVLQDYLITNLGKLDFPKNYGNLELDSIFGFTVFNPLGEKLVGVATFGGKMSFTFSFDESLIDRETMEKIKQETIESLAKAVGWE